MPKKKSFKQSQKLTNNHVLQPVASHNSDKLVIALTPSIPPEVTNIPLPAEGNEAGFRNLDFSPYYGQHYDEVVFYTQQALTVMVQESIKTNGQSLAITTISIYFNPGFKYFFSFCAIWSQTLGRDMLLTDINKSVVESFISHLAASDGKVTSQKNIYSYTKSVLVFMNKRQWLDKISFPRNPYPNTNRKTKGQKPLSKAERRQVIRALKEAYRAIQNGTRPLTGYELTVCILIIGLRTGLNPTSIINLTTDCTQPHPIKENRRLLVAYKKRGNATKIQALRKSEDIESLKTIQMDVLEVIDTVTERNLRLRLHSSNPEKLFVFQCHANRNAGKISLYSPSNLSFSVKMLIETYGIANDDNLPLTLNLSRLRKTFINSIFELSNQDPIVTAKMGGHSLGVSDNHYLEPPKEAESSFRFMGELRDQELLEQGKLIDIKQVENTPTAKCKDTKDGHLAPKNGKYCDDFLGCFRCKSFVVTPADLYRTYSCYWLIVRERDNISVKKWSKYYGHIIRIIDNEIAVKFDKTQVSEARAKAKVNPHPFWRDTSNLEALPA